MSEIDKPANQPAEDPSAAKPVSAAPDSAWVAPTANTTPGTESPAAAVGQPETPSADQSTSDTPAYPAAPPVAAQAESGAPESPVAGQSSPSGDAAYTPGQAPVYAAGSAAGEAASGYTPGQAPVYPTGSPAADPGQGPVGGAGSPVSAPGYGAAQPVSGAAYGQPGYGHTAQFPAADQPVWTPPAAQPKKVPGAVKAIAIVAAAGVLSLCSGVAGALITKAVDNNGGINLPLKTDAAPVLNENSVAGVAAKIQPSVVSIATASGEGSGVILTEDGYILTNNHVVESARGGAITVTLSNGKKVKGKVVGTDPRTDLAVVKAEASGLTAATLADSGKVNVGDAVLAVGSPLGLQGSVTKGIISAKDRTIQAGTNSTSLTGLLQTDAPINPGNSGGALVDMNGNVIGINTAIATSGNGEGNIGVGFAIPSTKAKTVAEQLMKGAKVSHPFLGVSVTAEESGGAKISAISPNSPAAAAGLQEGDVITKFGDKVINDSDDLVSAVQSGTVGQKVTVDYTRNGEQKTATVTLAEAS